MSATVEMPDYSRRETTAAFIASILLHLLIILLIAWGATALHVSIPEPSREEPVEITILSNEPPQPATPQFVQTSSQEAIDTPPASAPFESDNNTRAASESPPSGNQPLPSIEGREAENIELQNRDYTAGREAEAAPPVAEVAPQLPIEKAVPFSTPLPQTQLALLEVPKATQESPTQKTSATTEPRKPTSPGYQPETRVTRLRGNISNRGKASVEAAATPLGRYKKMLSDAIGSRWYYYVNNQMDVLNIGTVNIRFVVNSDGKVQNVRVISNSSNESFASVSINAIMEAEIPPVSQDVAKLLENGRIEVDYSFTILGN